MMTFDPAVLGGAVVGLVTLQLTSLGILLAVLRFGEVDDPAACNPPSQPSRGRGT